MNFWDSFWTIFLWFFFVYVFFAFLYALFIVIGDVFRDDTLNGWLKAVWIVLLAFLPFLTLVVYLIARGKGMTQRSRERARQDQESTEAYIRSAAASGPAASSSPSEEIAKAKALLDSGTISAAEFETLKSKVMV
ncbi:hypothetical protein BJG92_02816 [Arthrobacter sp. SO5]|uniref:SHOCT domain-containing protein n=1 Tax=Arthrobacter sp. SO5 TaxID=1897055 RepID=UPI001E3060B0|nr:SHOCT domain-containing protein [Arthrobacter sp. SO5]MCB5275268.1 hypothetical protein [Arthrobacter sp. SO5]